MALTPSGPPVATSYHPLDVQFCVVGRPQPKGSTRAFYSPKHARILTWADNRERLKPWEDCVRAAARRAVGRSEQYPLWPAGIPVRIEVTFVLTRPTRSPGRRRGWPSVKPDLSKLVRGLEDALTGIVYGDDAQIVSLTARKVYETEGSGVRAEVAVWRLPEEYGT